MNPLCSKVMPVLYLTQALSLCVCYDLYNRTTLYCTAENSTAMHHTALHSTTQHNLELFYITGMHLERPVTCSWRTVYTTLLWALGIIANVRLGWLLQ